MKKSNGKRMKGFISLLIIVTMLMVQACSTGDVSSNSEPSNDNGDKKGGILKVLRQSDATNLDPHFITDIPSANVLYQKVYETLVTFDKNMEIVPDLAKSWEQPNPTTWEFTLNEGITFHDGAPFNAEAVKVTFDRLLDPDTGSPQRDKLSMIEEVIVVDEYKVQLKLSDPYAPLLSILASNEGSIISPKAIKENEETLSKKPVGTGPFKFESWESGQSITLLKNEDYWGEKPNIDGIEFTIVPEASTRLAMIETGEAHISDQVPVTEIERIENSDVLNLYRTEGLAVEYVGFNTQKAPLDNVKVRQAISSAIEREAIIKGIYNGVGTLANSAMSPKVFGYSPNIKPYEYDPNKAKELLKEAGFKDGLEINLITSDREERIDMAEVIQSQLKGIGVNVSIQVLEYGAYIEAVNNGEHDMFIGGWGNATGDGDYNQYNLFHSSSHGPAGNHFYYTNEKVDELIEQARKETDPKVRKELYEEAMKIEIDEAVYVPIRNYEHLAVYNNNVDNFWLNAVNYLMVDDATIK